MRKGYVLLLSLVLMYLSVSAKITSERTVNRTPQNAIRVSQLVDFVVVSCRFVPKTIQFKNNVDMPSLNSLNDVYITIQNIGFTGASFQANQMVAKVLVGGKTAVFFAPSGGYYFEPKATAEFRAQIPIYTNAGVYTATCTVNPDHVIAENFSNNVTQFQVVLNPTF